MTTTGGDTVSTRIHRFLTAFAWLWIGTLVMPLLVVNAADAPPDEFHVLKGDYGEITAKGAIRFLVHGAADYLPHSGDPRAAEREQAEQLANRLGTQSSFHFGGGAGRSYHSAQ
jgi:hypothetical protein